MAAASSPPPIIPVTQSQAVAATSAASAADASRIAAIRAVVSRLTDSARRSLSNARPWSELADRSALSRPDSFSDALARARKNLTYFRVNYSAVVFAALALSLLTNPAALIALAFLLGAWSFAYLLRPSDQPLVILGRQFSDRETLFGLSLLTILVVFLTSVGSVIISAILVGAALVFVHAAFRVPEDLFLDDQENADVTTGFLSFFTGGSSNVTTGPAVALRV